MRPPRKAPAVTARHAQGRLACSCSSACERFSSSDVGLRQDSGCFDATDTSESPIVLRVRVRIRSRPQVQMGMRLNSGTFAHRIWC